MDDLLTDVEVRVLGSLIEKERTTPENYPLSLNALTNACNQSLEPRARSCSTTRRRSRDAIESLRGGRSCAQCSRAARASRSTGTSWARRSDWCTAGGRACACSCCAAPRRWRSCARAAVRLAALRESRGRRSGDRRAHRARAVALVTRLPRRPGQKEVRYAHLLAGEVTVDVGATPAAPSKRRRDSGPDWCARGGTRRAAEGGRGPPRSSWSRSGSSSSSRGGKRGRVAGSGENGGCHSERSRAAAEARNRRHPGRGASRSGRVRFLASACASRGLRSE